MSGLGLVARVVRAFGGVVQRVPLGERAVDVSLAELLRDARERPLGSNAGPDVARYLAGAVRYGRLLGLAEGEWCAAAACWAAEQARREGEAIPHAWRASGIEIQRDAQQEGAWRSVSMIRLGGYRPRRGDLAIFQRGDPGSWKRHVARLEIAPDDAGRYRTIGGNECDRWRLTWRALGDADLLGVVAYP